MDYFALMVKMLETFHLLHRNILHDFKSQVSNDNLNKTQQRVLMHLYVNGKNTMGTICKITELQQGSMTSVIDSLVELGYVERNRGENDRRKLYITLTSDGLIKAEEIKEQMSLYLKEKFKSLSIEDVELFSKILDQLKEINLKLQSGGEKLE
ncbi:MAG: MarR family transcriptional regulator [Halanaerobiales bacterium]|nr:MarR family transcriptional regulator [Halanaerobiales bacterium]